MFGLLSSDIGIDLGTANTLVHVSGRGIVVNEPSVVAVDRRNNKVLAIGSEAKRMLGRTPGEVIAIRPMKDGVIADFQLVESLLTKLIKTAQKYPLFFLRPRIVIGVPSGITEVEKRAVLDAARKAGAREVHLVAEPMAAAIGMGIPVEDPSGSMVIDIGGGTSEIAVIALYGIVCDTSVRVGGDEMDEAIISYLKKNYNLLVGESMAEKINLLVAGAAAAQPFSAEQKEYLAGFLAAVATVLELRLAEQHEAAGQAALDAQPDTASAMTEGGEVRPGALAREIGAAVDERRRAELARQPEAGHGPVVVAADLRGEVLARPLAEGAGHQLLAELGLPLRGEAAGALGQQVIEFGGAVDDAVEVEGEAHRSFSGSSAIATSACFVISAEFGRRISTFAMSTVFGSNL